MEKVPNYFVDFFPLILNNRHIDDDTNHNNNNNNKIPSTYTANLFIYYCYVLIYIRYGIYCIACSNSIGYHNQNHDNDNDDDQTTLTNLME